MTESYESIRDHRDVIPSEAREAWIKADQAERMLNASQTNVASRSSQASM